VTGLCFVTGDKLIPYSVNKKNAIKGGYASTQYIYTQKNAEGIPTKSVIVSKFSQTTMYNVIVLDFSKKEYSDVHQLKYIYHAKTGKNLPDKWVLHDVTQYKISNDGIFVDIDKLESMDILEGQDAKNAFTLMINSVKKEREINNKDLRSYIKLLKQENLDEEYRYMLNKYLQRFFHPFVCILLAIMGSLLGFSKPREQKLIGFTIAIGCIFIYYITLPFFDLLAEKGVLHPFITAIFPPVAFLCAIVAFYKSKDL
jgi:lipopolysaccharide export LptBFGC system permease protein LptF